MRIAWSLVWTALTLGAAWAQPEVGGVTAPDSGSGDSRLKAVEESYSTLRKAVDVLGQVKVGGYIQSQYQHLFTDSTRTITSKAVPSTAGGDFGPGITDRLMVRRAYLKTSFTTGLAQYVVNLELNEASVGIKDLFLKVTDPWTKSAAASFGLMDIPFGFEVPYSSALRESPERSRVVQTLFPGEKDMGFQLEWAPTQGALHFLNAKAGVFNGTGIAKENDNAKSLVGRLGFLAPLGAAGLEVDGGVSGYYGQVTSLSDSAFGSVSGSAFRLSSGNVNATFDREYLGADLQLKYRAPVLGNGTLRGEVIGGKQPGNASSSRFYSAGVLYERNFLGGYVDFVQELSSPLKLVLKYDYYDPNTDLEGSAVGAPGSNTGLGDVRFQTIGAGLLYDLDKNIRLTLFWDSPMNEKIASGPYASDLDDQVATARVQYKF